MTFQSQGKKVVQIELEAIQTLLDKIDNHFNEACELLFHCKGRIIVIGMGKSGHIGNKIAATLASTGSPAYFVHAAEASHGDLGMITKDDVIMMLSYSGTTPEILTLLPILQQLGVPIISITGKKHSPLAKAAKINLDITIPQEACPHNLAPSASTTAMLVMGDALAIALLNHRKFTPEDFALSHPGGNLGKRLSLRVKDLMYTGNALPQVTPETSLQQAILEVTKKRLGATLVVDEDAILHGIFTDGDLRRAFEHNLALKDTPIREVMSKNPKTINADALAATALEVMENYKITTLAVTDEANRVLGMVHMHALVETGII
jgi:arabinose-5-phosphate isomerase